MIPLKQSPTVQESVCDSIKYKVLFKLAILEQSKRKQSKGKKSNTQRGVVQSCLASLLSLKLRRFISTGVDS